MMNDCSVDFTEHGLANPAENMNEEQFRNWIYSAFGLLFTKVEELQQSQIRINGEADEQDDEVSNLCDAVERNTLERRSCIFYWISQWGRLTKVGVVGLITLGGILGVLFSAIKIYSFFMGG